MASIPTALIAPLRLALQSQGFPAETIGNNGLLNPAGLLAGAYDTIELRSNVSPNIRINTKELLQNPDSRNPFLAAAKPTVILSGPSGMNVIAPYGSADSGGWVVPLFVVGLFVGVGVLIGRATA